MVVVVGDHGQLPGVPLIVKPVASRGLGRATYREQFQMTDVFGLTLELAGLADRNDASLSSRVSAGRPVRDLTFAEIRHVPTPEAEALPRWAATAAKMRTLNLPKTIHDQLGLRPGDYLQVDVADGRVVFTPKTLVDKRLDQRIAESAEDFAAGRSYGPFESAEAMVTSLRAHVRARRGLRKVRR